MESVRYSWRWRRFWLGLGAFWLVSMFGPISMPRAAGEAWITLAMLVFVTVCMTTHRGNWSRWKKIAFVLAAWIVQTILMIPIAIVLAVFVPQIGINLDKSVIFLASLPVIVFAMRYSREFVRPAVSLAVSTEMLPPELIPDPLIQDVAKPRESAFPEHAFVHPEFAEPQPQSDHTKIRLVVGFCTCGIIVVALLIWANFPKENKPTQPTTWTPHNQPQPTTQIEPNTQHPYIHDTISDLDLALRMHRAGRPQDAFVYYSEAIRKNPKSAGAYNGRGVLYSELGETDMAIRDLGKAIEINPSYDDAYNNRGEVYRKKKMYREALADYQKAVQLEPNFPEAHYNMGLTYERSGKRLDAATAYRKYLELNPDAPDKTRIEALIKTLSSE